MIWKKEAASPVKSSEISNKDKLYAKVKGTNGCIDSSSTLSFTVWPLPAKPIITKTGSNLTSNYITGNQWYEGAVKIAGAINQNYSPIKTATFYVDHTDTNSCTSPLSDPFNFVSGISKIKVTGLKIYPNPASDFLIIETKEVGKFKISLIDLAGKLIAEEAFNGKRFEWVLKPTKGIYFIKIANENGETESMMVEFK